MLAPTEKLFQKDERQLSFRRLFQRVFLDDWFIKAVALVITFALWLGVTGLRAPTTARLKNITLNLRVSNSIEVTNSPVQEVDLVVTGDKRKIDQINPRDLVASLDLTEVQAGDRTVQITPENMNVELPTGVKLEEVQPNKIAIKLEAVQEREIPVKAETEGSVAEGFEIYGTAVLPNKVSVRGPESYIKSLDSVSTEKINLENRREDFTAQQVGLNLVNPKATLIDTVVDVVVKIGEKRIERLFIVPVRTETQISTATVVLYGAHTILDALKAENLQVEIIKTDSGENSLRLVLPADIQGKAEIRKFKVN
ncbi:MAG: CdaR family protein [Pyrinomonadaceae bacterium]